jgi:hypothetical protein
MEIVDFVFGIISALPSWLFPTLIVAFLVLRMALHLRATYRRSVGWEKAAAELGLHYRSDVSDLASHFPALGMLAVGSGTRWLNVLQGDSSGLSVCLVDRSGSSTLNRTLCILQSPDFHLAPFSFRRERGLLRRFTSLGREASGIEDDPASLHLSLGRKNLDVEAADDTVAVSYGRLIDPAQARELLADAKEALSLLSSRSG